MTVLGLTGRETEQPAKFNTFCDLCKRRIWKGEKCLQDAEQYAWHYHLDCALEQWKRMHNTEYRRDAKVRGKTRKTLSTPLPKERLGDGTKTCRFCRKVIAQGEVYYQPKRLGMLHKQDCFRRCKAALGRDKKRLSPSG